MYVLSGTGKPIHPTLARSLELSKGAANVLLTHSDPFNLQRAAKGRFLSFMLDDAIFPVWITQVGIACNFGQPQDKLLQALPRVLERMELSTGQADALVAARYNMMDQAEPSHLRREHHVDRLKQVRSFDIAPNSLL